VADDEDPPAVPEVKPSPPPSADGRRTAHGFLTNYGRGVVGVFSKDELAPLLITTAASSGSALFDDNVVRYFSARRRARWLGESGDKLGQAFVIGPMALAFYGLGRLNHHQSFRDATYDIAEVTLVAVTYTTALKYTTKRERPDGSNKLSFPSGHAGNAFSWAAIGAHYYGWRLGVPAYALATLVGISRMEKNVHHLSDVVAGAGLGFISARSVIRKNSEPKVPNVGPTASLVFSPLRDAHGQGLGLQASLVF
jgi:membrane-associated phospholipid phosphatase